MVMRAPYHAPGGVAQGSRQFFTELQPGAEQSHLGVRLAQPERLGGFPHGQSFDVPQQEDGPVPVVQPGQRGLQQALDFALMHQLFRRLPPIRDVFRVGNGVVAVGFLGGLLQRDGVQALAFADDLEGRVGGDAQEPGGKGCLAAEVFQALQRVQECLLRHILGVLLVPEQAQRQRINPTFIAVGQLLKGIHFPGLGTRDQLAVAGDRSGRARPGWSILVNGAYL